MINNVNSTPSFGSTRFKLSQENYSLALKILNENNFWAKGLKTNKTPQEISDSLIGNNSVAFVLGKEDITIVGKGGGKFDADTIAGKLIKKVIPNAEHKKDVAPLSYNA